MLSPYGFVSVLSLGRFPFLLSSHKVCEGGAGLVKHNVSVFLLMLVRACFQLICNCGDYAKNLFESHQDFQEGYGPRLLGFLLVTSFHPCPWAKIMQQKNRRL